MKKITMRNTKAEMMVALDDITSKLKQEQIYNQTLNRNLERKMTVVEDLHSSVDMLKDELGKVLSTKFQLIVVIILLSLGLITSLIFK